MSDLFDLGSVFGKAIIPSFDSMCFKAVVSYPSCLLVVSTQDQNEVVSICCLCFSLELTAFLVFLAFFSHFVAETKCFLPIIQMILLCSASSVSCCLMSPMKSFQTRWSFLEQTYIHCCQLQESSLWGQMLTQGRMLRRHGLCLHCATTELFLHLAVVLSL